MNKQELNEKINACLSSVTGIEIYFGMDGNECRKGNFSNAIQDKIKMMFINVINDRILADRISLLGLSEADDRQDAVFYYDIEIEAAQNDDQENHIMGAELLESVASPQNGIHVFSFDQDSISDIESLIIKIGNAEHDMVIYRIIPPINNYARMNNPMFFGKRGNIFDEKDKDFVKISPGVELLLVDGVLVIADLKFFEKATRYHEPIKRAARAQIESLNELGFLDSVDFINTAIEGSVSLARKLSKINENSPALAMIRNHQLSIDDFISYTRLNTALADKFIYSEEGKISISTKSHLNFLIKTLNDDYLISELTRIVYDSKSKDRI